MSERFDTEAIRRANPVAKIIKELTGEDVLPAGNESVTRCPFHNDSDPSLRIDEDHGKWYCDPCRKGGDVIRFVELYQNANFVSACKYLTQRQDRSAVRVTDVYTYEDEQGVELYEVCRTEPKGFFQRVLDGNTYRHDLSGVRRVLYELRLIRHMGAGGRIFIVEGEKDADRLLLKDLAATTNPGGAGKWRPEYTDQLVATGANGIVILPDNDTAGEEHGRQVATECMNAGLPVRVISLPGLPHKGDLSDWLDAGNTVDDLMTLVGAAADLTEIPVERGLKLLALADLLEEPDEEHDWVVDGMLPSAGISVLAAKPKVGKSTTARDLTFAVARGESFLGRPTKPGTVIYLAFEEKRDEIKKHYRRMGATNEDIRVLVERAPEGALEKLRLTVEHCRPALIVIDPLERMLRAKDINDYAKISLAIEPYTTLARETGAHLMFVHHAGKGEYRGSDQILGSTAIFGSVDTALMMRIEKQRRVLSSDQRYGAALPDTVLTLDPATGRVAQGEELDQVLQSEIAGRIVQYLRLVAGEVTEPDIEENVTGKVEAKRRALRQLVESNRVRRAGSGKKGNPFRYAATDTPASVDRNETVDRNEQLKHDLFGGPASGSMAPGERGNENPHHSFSDDQEEEAKTA